MGSESNLIQRQSLSLVQNELPLKTLLNSGVRDKVFSKDGDSYIVPHLFEEILKSATKHLIDEDLLDRPQTVEVALNQLKSLSASITNPIVIQAYKRAATAVITDIITQHFPDNTLHLTMGEEEDVFFGGTSFISFKVRVNEQTEPEPFDLVLRPRQSSNEYTLTLEHDSWETEPETSTKPNEAKQLLVDAGIFDMQARNEDGKPDLARRYAVTDTIKGKIIARVIDDPAVKAALGHA